MPGTLNPSPVVSLRPFIEMEHKPNSLRLTRLRQIILALFALLLFLQWHGGVASAQEPNNQKLGLTIAPPVLLADGTVKPVVFVQLIGSDGLPVPAPEDTVVSLVSSHPLVADVPGSVTFRPGRSYAVGDLVTSLLPGTATITATSPGRVSASADVQTLESAGSTPPSQIRIEAAPATMLSGAHPPGRLSIFLVDSQGLPAPAIHDMQVTIGSSNPSVARVPETLTIPQGSHFAIADIEPLLVGAATIFALGSGVGSDLAPVRIFEPAVEAISLKVDLAPHSLVIGSGEHLAVIIQAVGADDKPVPFPCVDVRLASSSSDIATVEEEVSIECGIEAQYVQAALTVGNSPGAVSISAVATGFRPGVGSLTVAGRPPTQLKVFLAPGLLLEAEPDPGFAVVQVQDSEGVPVNSHPGITFRLVGGGSTLPDQASIPAGESYFAMSLEGARDSAQSELWFSNPTLASTHLPLAFQTSNASAEVRAPSGLLLPGEEVQVSVEVGSASGPLPGATLNWSATNGRMTDRASLTDDNGIGLATFIAGDPGDGVVRVTATKLGFRDATAEATISVVSSNVGGGGSSGVFGNPIFYVILVIVVLGVLYLIFKRFVTLSE